jgi:hypothetical protein
MKELSLLVDFLILVLLVPASACLAASVSEVEAVETGLGPDIIYACQVHIRNMSVLQSQGPPAGCSRRRTGYSLHLDYNHRRRNCGLKTPSILPRGQVGLTDRTYAAILVRVIYGQACHLPGLLDRVRWV